MSDTHRMVTVVCDGDRQPNAARELLTLEVCIWAYKEITEWVNRWDETAANPHMQ